MKNPEFLVCEIHTFIRENNITSDCIQLQEFLGEKGFKFGDLGSGSCDYTRSMRIAIQDTTYCGKCLVVGTANRNNRNERNRFFVNIYQGYYLPI